MALIRSDTNIPVPPPDTLIECLCDESGSMEDYKHQAIASFNEFLRDQKSIKSEASINIKMFNSEGFTDAIVWDRLRTCPFLDSNSLKPDGGTPLYDAIIVGTETTWARWKAHGEKQKVIIAVLTDGHDTESRRTEHDAQDCIETHKLLGFQFIFIAPDDWSAKKAKQLGFQHVIKYEPSKPKTLASSIAAVSKGIGDYRQGKPFEIEAPKTQGEK